jgi:hypothetical protein
MFGLMTKNPHLYSESAEAPRIKYTEDMKKKRLERKCTSVANMEREFVFGVSLRLFLSPSNTLFGRWY